MRFAVLALLCLAASACQTQPPPFAPGGVDGFTAKDIGAGGGGGGNPGADLAVGDLSVAQIDLNGTNQPGAPVITITAPAANAEVHGDTLDVFATVTSPMNTPIDPTSAKVLITPPGSQSPVSANMALSKMANVYEGKIDISALPSGAANFTVVAADITANTGSAVGSFVHDHGAVIIFLQPSAATAHGTLPVEVIINDTLHPITDPTKVVAGIRKPGDVTLTVEAGAVPLRLQGTVNLNDSATFGAPLDGPQLLTVTATNSSNTTTTATRAFTVDNVGPSITNLQVENLGASMPAFKAASGAFIGGVVAVQATLTDPSGVNDPTVQVVFGGDLTTATKMTRIAPTSDTFQGTYDIRKLGTTYVFQEISVRGNDLLGNTAQVGVEAIVDNSPPYIMINPPPMRVSKLLPGSLTQRECSQPFNPVGDDVVLDGNWVPQIVTLRARVEDQGNHASGLAQVYFSGLDGGSVYLFALPAPMGSEVLAVDTNGDGICDNVNPTLVPVSGAVMGGNEALSLQLAGIGALSTPDWTFGGSTNGTPLAPSCVVIGESGFAPSLPPCFTDGSPLHYIPPYADPTGQSTVWTIPPVNPMRNQCVGIQLDSANHLPDGPTCVVVVASDVTGNTNVSAPIHVCIDSNPADNGSKCPGYTAPGTVNGNPPKSTVCTGVYDSINKVLVNGKTCALPASFQPGEVRFLGM